MNLRLQKSIWVTVIISCSVSCYYEDISRLPDPSACLGTDLLVSAIPKSTTGCGINDGTITASATGGSGTYAYSKDGGKTKQQAGLFEGLAGGNYLIIAYDGSLCADSTEVVVTNSGSDFQVSVDSFSPDTGCTSDNGSVTLNATGATGSVSYMLGSTTNSTGNFTGLKGGVYAASASDANCTLSVSFSIPSEISTSYVNEIVPILESKCNYSECHSPNNPKQLADLTSYSVVYNYRSSIKTKVLNNTMPKKPKPDLTTNELALIVCWIDAGAQKN